MLLKQVVQVVNLVLYSCMISDQNKGSLFKFLNIIRLDWPSGVRSNVLSKQRII